MKDNKHFLRAVFPKLATAPEQVIDLSFLLEVPRLCDAFADAFLSHCAPKRLRTRSSLASSLRGGFIKFLSDRQLSEIALSDIQMGLMTTFVTWLNDRTTPDGTALTYITRRCYLSALRGIFEALHRSSKYKLLVSPELSIPKCCWPLGTRRGTPVETLADEELAKLYRACLTEMQETMLRVSSAERLLSEGIPKVPICPSTFRDYSDLATCLAALDSAFVDSPPCFNLLESRLPFLRAAISKLHGGLTKVRSFLYPDPRMLTPFVIFLAIHTGFNPDVVLTLSLGDFSVRETLGHSHLRFNAYKPRAREQQVVDIPVTKDSDNPSMVVDFLVQWGTRIRTFAAAHISKYLFLFLPRTNHTTVMAYCDPKKGARGQVVWHNCIRDFCADHGLKMVTLRQIRATVLDANMVINGGDIRAAKVFGNQKNVQTLYSHYSSDAQRQRNTEALGDTIEYIEYRARISGNKIHSPQGMLIHYLRESVPLPTSFMSTRQLQAQRKLEEQRENERCRIQGLECEYDEWCITQAEQELEKRYSEPELNAVLEDLARSLRSSYPQIARVADTVQKDIAQRHLLKAIRAELQIISFEEWCDRTANSKPHRGTSQLFANANGSRKLATKSEANVVQRKK